MKGRPGFVSATGIVAAVVAPRRRPRVDACSPGRGCSAPARSTRKPGQRELGGVTSHAALRATAAPVTPRRGTRAPWPTPASRVTPGAGATCAPATGLHGALSRTSAGRRAATGATRTTAGPDAPLTVLDPASFRSRRHRLLAPEPREDGLRRAASCAPTATPRTCSTFEQTICVALPPRPGCGLHDPPRGDLRQGLPALPRRHRPGRRGLRPQRRCPSGSPASIADVPCGDCHTRGALAAEASRTRRRTATPATPRTTSTTAAFGRQVRGLPHRSGLGRRHVRPRRVPARPRQRGAQGQPARPATQPTPETLRPATGATSTRKRTCAENTRGGASPSWPTASACHPGGREAEDD